MTCDHERVSMSVYRDPRTGRDHKQYVCENCGAHVSNPDSGQMV